MQGFRWSGSAVRTAILAWVAGCALIQHLPEAAGMIITLPLEEMVRQADVVMIAEVAAQEALPALSGEWPRVRHRLRVVRILKGDLVEGREVILEAFGSLEEDVYYEDTPQIPAAGGRAVFFLRRSAQGAWDVVNAIQGVWPLDPATGELLGMGLGLNVHHVIDVIRHAEREHGFGSIPSSDPEASDDLF